MGQTSKVSGVATSIRTHGKNTIVRYHNTDVVTFTDKTITLDSGGWETVTTKLRMNQAANQFGLGYYVSQKNFEWFVTLPSGKTVDFKDNMKIGRG
jgi:hypothetical protein